MRGYKQDEVTRVTRIDNDNKYLIRGIYVMSIRPCLSIINGKRRHILWVCERRFLYIIINSFFTVDDEERIQTSIIKTRK